jgi:hypothetical protein
MTDVTNLHLSALLMSHFRTPWTLHSTAGRFLNEFVLANWMIDALCSLPYTTLPLRYDFCLPVACLQTLQGAV